MTGRKRFIGLVLCLFMAAGPAGGQAETAGRTEGEQAALEILRREMTASATSLLQSGDDVRSQYPVVQDPELSYSDQFPEKFDLREYGLVTPAKSQENWGTCWAFSTVGASEISILSGLGLTAAEYAEKYGEEMDLSERHLAYFTSVALPDNSALQYPFLPTQAGEGRHMPEGVNMGTLETGGNHYMAASSLASGIGMVPEAFAPYQNPEGAGEGPDDGSLPEEKRFWQRFELKDAHILPTPAGRDADGNYVYQPEGTAAFKRELLRGHGIAVAFQADQSMAELTPEQMRASTEEAFEQVGGFTEEEKQLYLDVKLNITDPETLPRESLEHLVRVRCRLNKMAEDLYDVKSLDREDLILILQSQMIGDPIETIRKEAEKEETFYMNCIGEDPVIYAHYTYEPAESNHGACIVGWDDTFPASNFREDHQPPGDGAWIAKNSWGDEWGMGGFFYISYYDMSLCSPASFEYADNPDSNSLKNPSIYQYDYMPMEIVTSALFDTPVRAASLFEISEDAVLQHVSTMTAEKNTSVTASVYLLQEGAASPTDGILLESVTESFEYAGYHRITLPESLALRKGSKISVTVVQRIQGEDGIRYALTKTSCLGEKALEVFAERHAEEGETLLFYCTGIVNPGENSVSFEAGRWIDWREILDEIGGSGDCACIAYDNLPIKAYTYSLQEIQESHDLGEWNPTAGGRTAVCPECGYVLREAGAPAE